jgi:glycosyltransferase involved in cell wall biosynthesis
MLDNPRPGFEFVLFYAGGGLNRQQQNMVRGLEIKYPHATFAHLPFSEPFLTRLWQRAHLPVPLEWVARLENPFPFPNQIGKLDVVHFPDFVRWPHRYGKDIVTVHDLSFMVVPECADDNLRRYLTAAVPHAVRRADKVIVVSESIKNELVDRLQVAPGKVSVVYNGVGPQFKPIIDPETLEETRTRLGLPQRFALFVSTIEPRKNITRLVEAWQAVKNSPEGKDYKLVLAGRRGWKYEPIFRRIAELKLQNEIIWLDFVPDKDLPTLYSMAELFVFPSLYEGFGIPPLEALACGTPVVVSDNSALKEVFEGVAVLCNAQDISSITESILKIMRSLDGDKKLVSELRENGLERAHRFTWERAAEETLKVYCSLA